MTRHFCAAVAICAGLLIGAGLFPATHAGDETPSLTPESSPNNWLVPTEEDERPYWRRSLLKRFLGDQKFLVTSWWPAEARRYSFSVPLVVSLVGASGSAHSPAGIDLRWQRSIEQWTLGGRRDVAQGLTRLGNSETAVVLIGSTYLIARWTGGERTQRAASLSAEALLNTALYSGLLKRITRRTRPADAGIGKFFVQSPIGKQEPTSFPSGHAMGAFAVAAVFSWEFRDKRWVPWVAYGTAGMIAVSRVALGRHFPSDVVAGALLGRSLGRMVTERAGGAEDAPRWTRIEPLFDPSNNGFGLAYRHTW